MAQPEHTRELSLLEEALTVLFCLLEDDTYAHLSTRRQDAMPLSSGSQTPRSLLSRFFSSFEA